MKKLFHLLVPALAALLLVAALFAGCADDDDDDDDGDGGGGNCADTVATIYDVCIASLQISDEEINSAEAYELCLEGQGPWDCMAGCADLVILDDCSDFTQCVIDSCEVELFFSEDDDDLNDDVDDDANDDANDDLNDDVNDDLNDDVDDDIDDDAQWPGDPWYGCADDDQPDTAVVVTVFDLADQYYVSGDENLRTIDAPVDFPEGDWERINLRLELSCPADGDCDNWDRLANIYLVEDPGGENEESYELLRYITPYNEGMCIHTDVSDYAALLTGARTLRSFISTWVGPGSPHGHGWRVTLKFIFHPGVASRELPTQILNVWSNNWITVGDPDNLIGDQIGIRQIEIPAGVTRAETRLLVTGHGQGNQDNCAEFCHSQQVILVNDLPVSVDPWRSDCSQNPLDDQDGTWRYSRAGWCPGAVVLPHVSDVTALADIAAQNNFGYEVWDSEGDLYINNCRPGAGDENNICQECAFDDDPGNCDYDGGMHTEPRDQISVQLFLYGQSG